MRHFYFLYYKWTGPNGSGDDWLEFESSGPIESGFNIHQICREIVAARPEYSKVTPVNFIWLRNEPD